LVALTLLFSVAFPIGILFEISCHPGIFREACTTPSALFGFLFFGRSLLHASSAARVPFAPHRDEPAYRLFFCLGGDGVSEPDEPPLPQPVLRLTLFILNPLPVAGLQPTPHDSASPFTASSLLRLHGGVGGKSAPQERPSRKQSTGRKRQSSPPVCTL